MNKHASATTASVRDEPVDQHAGDDPIFSIGMHPMRAQRSARRRNGGCAATRTPARARNHKNRSLAARARASAVRADPAAAATAAAAANTAVVKHARPNLLRL